MELRPHHVGIVVSDLTRSKAFYSALGFEQAEEHVMADKTISFMRLGGLQVELFAYHEPVQASQAPERVLGFKHLALECDDVDVSLRRLKEAGVVADDVAIRELPGGWRLAFFNDPDGLEIEIKQA